MKNIFLLCCLSLCIFSIGDCKVNDKKSKIENIETLTMSEERCIEEINKMREKYNKPPLKAWPQLSDCAREHSLNMANKKCDFGHDGFDQRYKNMQKQAHVSSFAENVAYSHNYDDPVLVAVEGWMESPGHKKNILGNFEETGVGIAISKEGKFFITQLFAKRPRNGLSGATP